MTCELPITQTELADALVITPAHVNRVVQELRRDGLIQLRDRELTVPDLDALETVAMSTSDYLHLPA